MSWMIASMLSKEAGPVEYMYVTVVAAAESESVVVDTWMDGLEQGSVADKRTWIVGNVDAAYFGTAPTNDVGTRHYDVVNTALDLPFRAISELVDMIDSQDQDSSLVNDVLVSDHTPYHHLVLPLPLPLPLPPPFSPHLPSFPLFYPHLSRPRAFSLLLI
eukprot:CAMPEP_0184704748 /NCGR_PEP_ID=MMETSP0313-20130426/32236_1 /TAXON_ID=2792 /ORGANISM="Porphyridium aerugineum, Strain SAG 1380-2" /LENGTH=159 /DNA_ID=CAMNT_0027165895 /DNA_START=228 /DNA_END=707 /DNA_ORIENTATION=+